MPSPVLEYTSACLHKSRNATHPNISNIRGTKLKYFSSRLAVVFAQLIEARRWVENEDIGDAPTKSESSASLLRTKVQLILEVWR